jgi:hypothetical protein
MAASEIVVEWFVPIVLLTMVVTAIIIMIRRTGRLRLGRPLKLREVATLMIILAWNFTIVLPIYGIALLIEYTSGNLPELGLVITAALVLAQIIPLVLVTAGFVFLLAAMHKAWGVAGLSLLLASAFWVEVALIGRGFAHTAIEGFVSLLQNGTPHAVLTLFPIILLSMYCMKSSAKSNTDEPNQQSRLPQYSNWAKITSSKLLGGLGKRVLIDGDSLALGILSEVYHKSAYTEYVMGVAAKERGLAISDATFGGGIESARSNLASLMKPYGIMGRQSNRALQACIITTIVLLIVTFYLLVFTSSIMLGFLFGMATVFMVFPFVLLTYGASYGPDRYMPIPVPHRESYFLTETEFKHRVALDRSFFVLALILLGTQVYSALGIHNLFGWYWPLAGIVILAALLLLSRSDNILCGRRVGNEETVKRALEYIGALEAEKKEGIVASHFAEPEQVQYPAGKETPVSTDWKQRLEQLGFEGFAKRVECNSAETCGETMRQYVLLRAGGVFLMFGVILISMFYGTDFLRILTPLPEVLLGLGLVIFGAGAVEWLLDRRRRPLGIAKKQLTLTVTWLDLKVRGIESPGLILDAPYPSEYFGFGLKGIMGSAIRVAILSSITKLGSQIPWSSEDARRVGSESSRYEAMGIVAGVVGGAFLAAIWYFLTTTVDLSFMGDVFARASLMMLLLAVFCFVGAVRQAAKWARTKSSNPPWLRGTMLGVDVSPIDTLTALLRLLVAKCESPLRVLVLGDYAELAYTGRVYRTDRGFELKEAVFIPNQ